MNQKMYLGLIGTTMLLLAGGCVEDRAAQAPPPPPVQVAEVAPANPANLSPGAAEVLRLAQAGTGDDVIVGYVQNYSAPFALSADQIVYLRNAGISSSVISAMLNRDTALQVQAQAYVPAPTPSPVYTPAPAPVDAPPPVYVSSPPPEVTYFYDGLSPYGTWVQLDGVGWCWQPREVVLNRAWQPYCDSGHWVYTDAGWYWQSDYAWGWAPFHYGRWQLHDRCGWVWVPDRVWGPSWVVWRTEGDRCGWAPLPPHADFDAHLGWRFNGVAVAASFDFGLRPQHFSFIAMHDFNDHDLAHRRLEQPEVTRIYNNTTIVNNYVVNNTTVINQGIKVERVAAATHSQIQRVPVHDVPAGSPALARSQTTGHDVVYRTQLQAPARAATAMVAQKVDDRHPVIAHTPAPATAPNRPLRTPTAPSTAPVAHNPQPSQPAVAPRPEGTAPAAHSYSNPSQSATVARNVPPNQPTEQAHPVAHPPTSVPHSASTSGTPVASRATPEPIPAAHQPASHPATPQPNTSHLADQPKPASRATTAFMPAPKPAPAPTVVRLAEQQNPAPSSAGAARPEGGQLHPLRMNAPSPAAPTESSHVYPPKGAHQAAEAHALSPVNAHAASGNPANGAARGQSKKTE